MRCCVLGSRRTDSFRIAACAVVWWISCLGCSDHDELRECSRREYGPRRLPISIAYSDCEEGIYRTRATVRGVFAAGDGGSGSVELELPEGACYISFDVAQPVHDWPSWPWLVEGAQLDISLWDTGGNTRGGDPLWMVLRDSVTGDPLFSIYQLNGFLIADGTLRDEVGIDAEIVGPVCKDSALAEQGLLIDGYDLRFSSQGERITLGQMSEGSLPSSNASLSWSIQTGILVNRLLDRNSPLLDVRVGEFFQVVAWIEPQ
jgi:hypothetical protein